MYDVLCVDDCVSPSLQASLARMRFSEVKYDEACGHYEQALAVKPLLTAAWFSLGVARMRLGRWQESLQAFSTVVQQEPEEGEVRRAGGGRGALAFFLFFFLLFSPLCS